LPEVSTFRPDGLDFRTATWFGGPARLARRKRSWPTLHRDSVAVLRDDVARASPKEGAEIAGDPPDQFRAFKDEMDRPDPRRQHPAGLRYAAANNVGVIARLRGRE
jgi:hypothetical protein